MDHNAFLNPEQMVAVFWRPTPFVEINSKHCKKIIRHSSLFTRYHYDFVKFGRQDDKAYSNCTLGRSLSEVDKDRSRKYM